MTPEEIIAKLERQLTYEVERRMKAEAREDKLRKALQKQCEDCRYPEFLLYADGRREKLPCAWHGVAAHG